MTVHDWNPDGVLQDALAQASGGLDLVIASRAIQDAVEALAKQAKALKDARYDPKKFDQVARAMNHTMKMVDELARLVSFAKGQPDSRPDLGAGWLQGLTDAQLTQVQQWIARNKEDAQAEKTAENPKAS